MMKKHLPFSEDNAYEQVPKGEDGQILNAALLFACARQFARDGDNEFQGRRLFGQQGEVI